MLPPWLPSPRTLGALQRVLLVALLTPAVLIALTAAVPALILLPFFPGGTDRAIKLLTAHTRYLGTLLTNSRPAP
ncbi:dTMP kinase [Streptomyces turgidiscabies]|uniref:dTMP kinase n=1 Tax=Streptomyces turgidiscabies TaxID=85558 RepID=UPI0038F631DB